MAIQPTVVTPTKSVGVSILLTIFLGPLGMLYSTIAGALIMFIVSVIGIIFTAGLSLIITWPICIIWGAVAVTDYNDMLYNKINS